jgi:hypothetical protein
MNKGEKAVSIKCVTITHLNTFRRKALSKVQNVIAHDIFPIANANIILIEWGFVDRIAFSPRLGEGM